MSTTTVCRGLQSRLEAQVVEPLTLRLTLAPRPLNSDSESNVSTEDKTANGEFGGWSFLDSLVKDSGEAPYVHPLDKSSTSALSNKSLDLCTESLGCETGSDIGDESDVYSSSSSDSESRRCTIRERTRLSQPAHKKAAPRCFPPPLTSISGSDYVQYTPHREGGRLVIRAVKITNSPTCFQAERVNGRLTLRFKECYDSSCSCSEADTDEDDEENQGQEQEQEQDACLNEKETAIVKCQRPCSWYKDGGHGNKRLLNWKPFLGVAI